MNARTSFPLAFALAGLPVVLCSAAALPAERSPACPWTTGDISRRIHAARERPGAETIHWRSEYHPPFRFQTHPILTTIRQNDPTHWKSVSSAGYEELQAGDTSAS